MQDYLIYEDEIGMDEAGRGPLFGYVYAAAVIWRPLTPPPENLIMDSKKLTPKKRKMASEWIMQNIPNYAVAYATNIEIDEMNIFEATALAMNRALTKLLKSPDREGHESMDEDASSHLPTLVIDGLYWEKKFPQYNVKSVVKGDSKIYSIAAASILAKEFHDRHILELCTSMPSLKEHYHIHKNMGYPSKQHIDGIRKYGFTEYHRKTFRIKSLMESPDDLER